jgi:hypothetical protein
LVAAFTDWTPPAQEPLALIGAPLIVYRLNRVLRFLKIPSILLILSKFSEISSPGISVPRNST